MEDEKRRRTEENPEAEKLPANEEPKKRHKRRKKRGGKILLFLMALVTIAAACVCIYTMTPSKKRVDFRSYFGLADGVSYGLLVNQERIGSFPVKREGYWYIDFNTVYTYVSKKFYYDGEYVLYTNPTKTYAAKPDGYSYTDDGGLSYQLNYQPCYLDDGRLYLALDYLKLMDFCYYLEDTDRCYVWLWNNWSEMTVKQVEKGGAVRFGSGIKKDIVDEIETGESVLVLEEGNKWDMVQTQDGLIGCIQRANLGEAQPLTAEVPDGRPLPEYTTNQLDETVIMAWHQVFTESGYNQLDEYLENADSLNVISPTWFTIKDNEGNIQSLADKKYVDKAHKAGIKVWGLVENINIEVDELQVLGVTEHRKRLVDALMEEAKRVGLDGINIDLEAVGQDNGEHLLQFIREMSAACRRAGLTLSVDNYSPMPHTAYYDRAQQGEIVDYVIVMAYDEHYVGGDTAGSTATVGWVKQSAERTLEEVPKEKLIVGLPVYTRLWKETPNGEEGTELTSTGIGMEACSEIVREHGLSMEWLQEEGQYYVEYEEDGSKYRLWIEDETSLDLKLRTAFSYEPAGIALFKLGLETDDSWVYIRKYAD